MEPMAVRDQRFDIGKCLIFFRDPVWDGTDALFDPAEMLHLGDTEGTVKLEPNHEYSDLVVRSVTGPAILKRYLKGLNPSFNVTVFPTPDRQYVFSPTGMVSQGTEFQMRVKEYSLWLVPQELFLKPDANGNRQRVAITYTGGTWEKDGDPLTAEETELLNLSLIIPKAGFDPLGPTFNDEDGGYAGDEITVQALQAFFMPSGCQLYLQLGELSAFPTLDLDGFVS